MSIGPSPVTPPAQLMILVSTGQSNDVGQLPLSSTSTSGANLMVHDSSGTYDTSNPSAGTLSLQPLALPAKPAGSSSYPNNLTGEDPATNCVNALEQIWQWFHFAPFSIIPVVVGIAGAALSNIKKGGTSNSYVASTYETRVVQNKRAGKSVKVIGLKAEHGEADASLATYATDFYNGLTSPYQTDLKAITGQSDAIPMLLSQQHSTPTQAGGGAPKSALQQLAAPGLVSNTVFGTPTFWLPWIANGPHWTATGSKLLGDTEAKIFDQIIRKGFTWTGLVVSNISVSGAVITVTYSRPACWDNAAGDWGAPTAITFDTSFTSPHQTGTLSAWANGKGFEPTDLPDTITSCTAGTPGTIVTANDKWQTGDRVVFLDIGGVSGANVATTVTRTSANHYQLDGTTVTGTYTSGGTGERVLTVSSVTSPAPDTVQITLSAPPSTGLALGYAYFADPGSSGGFGPFRGGLVRDQDVWVGPCSAVRLYNWAPTMHPTGLT